MADANPKTEELPKLTPAEFRTYNKMADTMNYYHNHFRSSWSLLYDACVASKRPSGMSIKQFLNAGLDFCSQLTLHHNIEEAHVFPILARKMPLFQMQDLLRAQHKEIHTGLEKLEKYLDDCRNGARELRLEELKDIMEGFGKVLWAHLDEEVEQLGAENMRKFWSIEEMKRMPM